MTAESFLLVGFCFLVWILWIPAVLIQHKAAGEQGGTTIAPVIPFFPMVAVLIGLGLNLWISHLGTWLVGGLHAILALSFLFTIILDLIKINRMPNESEEPTSSPVPHD